MLHGERTSLACTATPPKPNNQRLTSERRRNADKPDTERPLHITLSAIDFSHPISFFFSWISCCVLLACCPHLSTMARQQSVVLVMVALVMMGCIAIMCLAEGEVSAAEPVIVAQFAKDVSSRVRDRVLVLLATTGQQVKTVAADTAVSYSTLPARSIVFGFGNTTTTRTIVGSSYVTLLSSVGSEGFFVQSATAPGSPNVTIIGCDGNINANDPFLLSKTTNIGLHYGVYRALEVWQQRCHVYLALDADYMPLSRLTNDRSLAMRSSIHWHQ